MKLVPILAAMVGLTLVLSGSALAATRNVDNTVPCSDVTGTPYCTISAAITDASPGDTIVVAAGTYNEQVQITKTLTLEGAKFGVDARTRATSGETIIDHACGPVQIMADNVVIDGFTIQGSTDPDPCYLAGIWTNPGYSGTQGGHQILDNIVQNNISGIELDSTCVNPTLVQYNLIQNNNNPGPGAGNGIQTNFGLCNATIDSNKFGGHTNSSILISSGGDDQLITVSNNELVGGTPERVIFGSVDDSAITGNVSSGSTSSGVVRLFGGNNNIAVTGNVLLNGMRGIRVDNLFAVNTGVTVQSNCIVGNTVAGLEVETTGHSGTLNAENNWWGSATGPTNPTNPGGTGDAVVDPDGVVDFTPYLTSPTAAPCPQLQLTEKQCKKALEEQKKAFEDQQKADKKAFEDQQKADKQAFDSSSHSKAEKKAFEDQQKADKKAFEDQQKADKKAFEDQQKADREACKDLPKK